jgi:hypothetical protein
VLGSAQLQALLADSAGIREAEPSIKGEVRVMLLLLLLLLLQPIVNH